jgi:hypothetical protein
MSNTHPANVANAALAQAINSALPAFTLPAQHSATARNTAQQFSPQKSKSNPPSNPKPAIRHPQSNKPLRPNQLTAARLLLAGHSVSAAAASLKIHPYTLSRWKRNPVFQAELRRQTDAMARNTAQQKPASRNNSTPFWQNEVTGRTCAPPPFRQESVTLPRPINR